jgi:hypothetical protein
MTIGEHGRLTAEEARKQARLAFAEVGKGGDPAEAHYAARKAPTIAEFAERYRGPFSPVTTLWTLTLPLAVRL